jgi:uncharacterized protein (DUF1684 family)
MFQASNQTSSNTTIARAAQATRASQFARAEVSSSRSSWLRRFGVNSGAGSARLEQLESRLFMSIAALSNATRVTSVGVDMNSIIVDNNVDQPALSVAPNGLFAIAYRNITVGGSGDAGKFDLQRFSQTGQGTNLETVINPTVGASGPSGVSIARNNAGAIAAVFLVQGSDLDVFVRGFNNAGALTTESAASQTIVGDQANASVAIDSDGSSVVTWLSAGQIFARRFDAQGAASGNEFRIDADGTGADTLTASRPFAVTDGSGKLAVVWVSDRATNSVFADRSILLRRLDASDIDVGSVITVDSTPDESFDLFPSVALSEDGTFAVLLRRSQVITLYRFTSGGVANGIPVTLATATDLTTYPSASVDAGTDGSWLVAYTQSEVGGANSVLASRVISSGNLDGDPTLVSDALSSQDATSATIAAADDGNFVVAWGATGAGNTKGVFYRTLKTNTGSQIAVGPLNLSVAITALPVGLVLNPNARITLPVAITNTGTGDAQRVKVSLFIDTASTFNAATAKPLGTQTISILRHSTTKNLKIKGVVPGTLNDGDYHVFAIVDPESLIAETNETDNTATASGTGAVTLNFGLVNNKKKRLSLTDNLGVVTSFKLTGPGTANVTRASDGSYDVTLTGSTDRSSLSMSSKAPRVTSTPTPMLALALTTLEVSPTPAGRVNSINTATALRSITGKNTDLVGDVNVTGGLRSLSVRDIVTEDQTLTFGNNASNTRGTSITARTIQNTNITSEAPIRSLKAVQYLDDNATRDVVTAPSLGTLSITGSKKLQAVGDFQSDLQLTDADAVTGLKSAKIKGVVSGANVRSASDIGSVSAAGVNNSLFFAGVNNSQLTLPATNVSFVKDSEIRSFTVRGTRSSTDPTVINSIVAAQRIGKLNLGLVEPANGATTVGVATTSIGSYQRATPTTSVKLRNQSTAGISDSQGDFEVRIVGPAPQV